MTEYALALAVGTAFACGVYLLLQRSLGQIIIGLALVSNATNLLIFVAGGVRRAPPPIVPPGGEVLPPDAADPLPQALILTAIVIGFGVLAFFIALAARTYRVSGTDDPDQLSTTDRETPLEVER